MHHRKLRIEPLEARRLLAVVTVGNNLDTVNGDVTSIAALTSLDGGDGISIREAIEAANATEGADEIVFDFGHDGPEVVLLTGTELEITDSLTITGDGADLLTIDAQQMSRLFRVNGEIDFGLAGIALSNGLSSHKNEGGGAIFGSDVNLTLLDSVVENNRTTGEFAHGGAISAPNITLTNTIARSNRTEGDAAEGGAIFSDGYLALQASEISQNHTRGRNANGGGLSLHSSEIAQSTLSGNSTRGFLAYGGGVFGQDGGEVRLTNTTISGNWTLGFAASGGAIHAGSQALAILQTTIAENWTQGVQTYAGLSAAFVEVSIYGSILSDNFKLEFESNIPTTGTSAWQVDCSLISGFHPLGEAAGEGNLFDVRPRLAPIAANGGPTKTHALLPDSPALDAGDPSILFASAEFDQRGAGFPRVVDGGGGLRIDIGAYESQGVPGYPAGDYNHDGIASAADYTVWRDTLGETSDLRADGDGSEVVDEGDYTHWKNNFGNAVVPTTIASLLLPAMEATDVAFALFMSPVAESATVLPVLVEEFRIGNDNGESLLLLSGEGARPWQRGPTQGEKSVEQGDTIERHTQELALELERFILASVDAS